MASVTAGAGHRSLLGRLLAAVTARRTARPRRTGHAAAAVVAKAREHVVTVAALAAFDLGAFRASAIAGWIVLGACLLAFDFAVSGK